MTGTELIALTGAVITKRRGKRAAVKTDARFRKWARGHQHVLRDAFRSPQNVIDLTIGLSCDELSALGLARLENGRWTHPNGDHEMERLLLIPSEEARVLAADRKQRSEREARGLMRATVRLNVCENLFINRK
jgi:hypothetical protein